MRVVLLALALVGCSYDWNSVQPYYERDASADGNVVADPHHTIPNGTSCNPISTDGCNAGNYCLGMIEQDQSISSMTCRPSFGSGVQGTFCDGASNCTPGYVCWTDPDDATETRCQEPCFGNEDCSSGVCDTGGRFAVPWGRSTMYRCL